MRTGRGLSILVPLLAAGFAFAASASTPTRSELRLAGLKIDDPLAMVDSPANRASGAFSITLEVLLQTAAMRRDGMRKVRLSATNTCRAAYWTPAQLVAHHTVNGCNLRPGDLMGSGTLSGPGLAEAGSLMELTAGGKQPITLPNGEQRAFLEDGDTLILRGWCESAEAVRVGLGEARGTVVS